MLLPSSLPAQAASAIGSSRIAAIFANFLKRNSFHLLLLPDSLRPPGSEMEFLKQHRPTAIGEAMATWAGSDTRRRGGDNVDLTAPAAQFQPRLAGAMGFVASFGVACGFTTLICLWWR